MRKKECIASISLIGVILASTVTFHLPVVSVAYYYFLGYYISGDIKGDLNCDGQGNAF